MKAIVRWLLLLGICVRALAGGYGTVTTDLGAAGWSGGNIFVHFYSLSECCGWVGLSGSHAVTTGSFTTWDSAGQTIKVRAYRSGILVAESEAVTTTTGVPFEWHGTLTMNGTPWAGTLSGTWTGVTGPPSHPKHAWGQTVTNGESFVVRYRFRIDYATGEDFEEIFSLQPGEVRTLSVVNAVGFVPSVEVERVLPDGLGTAWVASTGLNPVTTTTESTATTPTNSGSTAAGNIWNSTTAPGRLGTQTPIAPTPSPRDDTSAASADALQRLMDANADKRHAELKSLLVAADNAQAKRDTVALDSSIAGLAGIRAQVAASGAAVVASLEAGKNNAPQTYGTTAATTGAQAGAGAAAGTLGGLIPTVTVPAGTPPVLTLPLSGLHESLDDAEWDFGSEELEPFVTAARAVELVGVTVFFFVASVKLLGRFANV